MLTRRIRFSNKQVMRILNLAFTVMLAASTLQAAQQKKANPAPAPVEPVVTQPGSAQLFVQNAEQTRRAFNTVMREYPPSLSEVFQLDPSLLTNDGYLQLYPRLAEFLKQHPEIAHNPTYFVGEASYRGPQTMDERRFQLIRDITEGLSIAAVFTAIVVGIIVLLRTIVNHRRWVRVSKIQEDVHSRLMDRLTSNEDLIAYMQTPAGKRFLESAPIALDAANGGFGSPAGRILLSVQIGVVLAFGGGGLFLASSKMEYAEVQSVLSIISALAIAVGIGFVVSAAVAYEFSKRMGLTGHKNELA